MDIYTHKFIYVTRAELSIKLERSVLNLTNLVKIIISQ